MSPTAGPGVPAPVPSPPPPAVAAKWESVVVKKLQCRGKSRREMVGRNKNPKPNGMHVKMDVRGRGGRGGSGRDGKDIFMADR